MPNCIQNDCFKVLITPSGTDDLLHPAFSACTGSAKLQRGTGGARISTKLQTMLFAEPRR